MSYRVAALYKFTSLPDYLKLRAPLQDMCDLLGVKGTLLLANEGLNGTVSGPAKGIDDLIVFLMADPRLADLDVKYSSADRSPFYRMKVRLKREIVTMGVNGIDPNKTVGTYVDPSDWNALISDPNTILIDTRNDYEVGIGTFKGAVNPNTKTFREFPAWVEANRNNIDKPKVAMFCTGGIRCEKASSFMLENGFDDVYHLKGGILKYLETVPENESRWEGECFVFDERVSVTHGLEVGTHTLCRACRNPMGPEDLKSDKFEEGISCPSCYDTRTEDQRARYAERQKQADLARQRGEAHIGDDAQEHPRG